MNNKIIGINELQATGTIDTTKQTPIEIALGIDENGMTTATKLYQFLGFTPSNYSKWFRKNIADNEFAEENTDYFLLVLKYEHNGIVGKRQDAKLTAGFAKKLSMMSKSEKGEQAREYFIRVENALKQQVMAQQKPDSYMIDDRIERAKRWIEEEQERVELRQKNAELLEENETLSEENEIMKPKAKFHDTIAISEDCITIEEMAKVLASNKIPVGRNRLYAWLREIKILRKNNLPYQKYVKQGFFKVREYTYPDKRTGEPRIATQTTVTPKGQRVIVQSWTDFMEEQKQNGKETEK